MTNLADKIDALAEKATNDCQNAIYVPVRREWMPQITRALRDAERIDTLFDAIAHGDADHRAWLKNAIASHFARQALTEWRNQ